MVFESGYSDLPRNITPKFDVPDIPSADSLIDIGAGANLLTGAQGGGHPLCDKNLLKDVDGVASLASLPSLPNLEDVLNATGIPQIPEKLDPKAMFTGVPEFTGLQDLPGIPDQVADKISNIDFKKEAKALADDVLNKLNISNPLDDLCAKVTDAAAGADSLINQIPDPSPNINNQMPNIDIPKFTDVVDIPEVGDIF